MGDTKIQYAGRKRSLGEWVLLLDEVLPWHTKTVYRGHTLKQTDVGWLLVLRGTRAGMPVVCFYTADTVYDCWHMLAGNVGHNNVPWREDRYA